MTTDKATIRERAEAEPYDAPYLYATNTQANLAIMKVINEIQFMERMAKMAPFIAKELIKAGVRFP